MGFRVWGSEFWVQGSGFGVQSLRFGGQGLGFRGLSEGLVITLICFIIQAPRRAVSTFYLGIMEV